MRLLSDFPGHCNSMILLYRYSMASFVLFFGMVILRQPDGAPSRILDNS
jgi:hypothetical protein